MRHAVLFFALFVSIATAGEVRHDSLTAETRAQYDARMRWWKEARFGLFIHWGLYSIPAGVWGNRTDYGEWIRTSAKIPLSQYSELVQQFNPTRFNAGDWVRVAKDAGMKYITITTKHHDGFCLFNTRYTDFSVAATPFGRDVMQDLSRACRNEGMPLCWYYSIMDWHHPDYLPRREWETARGTAGADFNRYVRYMKDQLRELLTNYGRIGVLWFDGEWEKTWNRPLGRQLYDYVRGLQPEIIVNNRVGAGRSGMQGFSEGEASAGDFGTPEQEVPDTGVPDVYWETCMTMNDHWGYNSHDVNWKSAKELVRTLTDVVSKGGNFLLNVGPTSDGVFPQACIDRLMAIGRWMKTNGEAIYGTDAGPFAHLPWGRCTEKVIQRGTRLYLHVFDWPGDGRLIVPGIANEAHKAYLLADPEQTPLGITRVEDALAIAVPRVPPDSVNSVVVLDVDGAPDVVEPPDIEAEAPVFTDSLSVTASSLNKSVTVRYTLDGGTPTARSPLVDGRITIHESSSISARCFRGETPASETARAGFTKVLPRPSAPVESLHPGVLYRYYEGDWESLPDFDSLQPLKAGVASDFDLSPRARPENFGFEYTGFIRIPATGVYTFFVESDDGSRLFLDDSLVVDNNGLHSLREESGVIALAGGLHRIRLTFFQRLGDVGLAVYYKGRGVGKQKVPPALLAH